MNATCGLASNAPCALDSQLALASFANCLEAKHGCENVSYAAPCAVSAGLAVDSIAACAAGDGAAQVMNHMYAVANASGVTGFPDIRVQRKQTPHAFPSFVEELERAICQAYSGPHPKACGAYIVPAK